MDDHNVEVVQTENGGVEKDAKTWGMLCHLTSLLGTGFIGPLVCWLIKKDEYDYVDYHGREALNFQITIMLLLFICLPLCMVFIGFLLAPLVGLYGFVFSIIAAIKANDGEAYRYPFCFRFIK